jgi:FkbM family methyltransferase
MEKIIHIIQVNSRQQGREFTIPAKLTSVQTQVIERAEMLHPGWEIKVWQDPVKAEGWLLEKYWTKVNSGAQFADLLRLDVLNKYGGVYIDSDLLLLKCLDDLTDGFDFFVGSEDGERLTNAVIGAAKGHAAIRALIEELLSNEPDWGMRPDVTTGPGLFTRTLQWNKRITVLPRETFYAYGPNEKHFRRNHRHSYGEHLWGNSWENSLWSRQSAAKHFSKRVLITGFKNWHRIKSVYHSVLDQLKYSEPKFYSASDELVVRTPDGFTLFVDGHDNSVTPELVFGGYERREENFIKRILNGGDWALDVGANVGSFSMLAGQRVGNFGRVFAYEPNPRPMKLLSKSMVVNWMHDRIVRRPVAVGDVAGHLRLAFLPERLGDAQINHEEVANSTFSETLKGLGQENLGVIDVPSVTLEEEFPVDLPIKLLKIDVEGYESAVLKGARRLLERRCVDFILIEVLSEVAGSRWGELLTQLKWLTQSNYVACTLEHDGVLIEHTSLTVALEKIQGRNIVLRAKDQFKPGFDLRTKFVEPSALRLGS